MIVAAMDLGASHGDLAIRDGETLHLSKHPLAGQTAAAGLDGLLAGLRDAGLDLAALGELRLSQTWALNAVLNRSADPVTLVTTRGFADVLILAQQDRADLYDPVARSPSPLFLVGRVIEIDERISATGEVVTPPDLSPIAGIRSGPVAICLLNAHRNGAHERALAKALPDNPVFLSHQVDCAPREYERAVATCLEAWLHGAIAAEIEAFRAGLAAGGFKGKLLLADGTGVLPDDPLLVDLLGAGPAISARAATVFDEDGPVIAADLGSCSLDLALIESGKVSDRKTGSFGGVPLRRVVSDTASVALGGQSRPVPGGPTVDQALIALGRLGGKPAVPADPGAAQAVAAMVQELRNRIIDFAVARNLDPFAVPVVVMGGLGTILAADIAEALGLDRIHLAPAPTQAGAVALLSAPQATRRYRAMALSLDADGTDALQDAVRSLRQDPPAGCSEVWTAEIAPSLQAVPERVPLSGAPASLNDVKAEWQAQMYRHTGVRPTQGALLAMELVMIRKPAPVPAPPVDLPEVPGWQAIPLANGGTMLERQT